MATSDGAAIPERTADQESQTPNEQSGEVSKNAAKKAAKREQQAKEKAEKKDNKAIGATEAKKPTNKQSKKKKEDDPLIGINVRKEDDFSGWYQQVLTKGEMLDYYDVSGCYILKVNVSCWQKTEVRADDV